MQKFETSNLSLYIIRSTWRTDCWNIAYLQYHLQTFITAIICSSVNIKNWKLQLIHCSTCFFLHFLLSTTEQRINSSTQVCTASVDILYYMYQIIVKTTQKHSLVPTMVSNIIIMRRRRRRKKLGKKTMNEHSFNVYTDTDIKNKMLTFVDLFLCVIPILPILTLYIFAKRWQSIK